MTGASDGGKGSGRRREDSAKVEANWPTEWGAREWKELCPPTLSERQQDPAWVEQQRAENLRRADLTITVDVIGGPNEVQRGLAMRDAMLTADWLGKLGEGGETTQERRERLFRENALWALVAGMVAVGTVVCLVAQALMVTYG